MAPSLSIEIETVTAEETGSRLDRWLKRRRSLTQGEVEKWIRTGQVRVDGARAKSNTRIVTGQKIRIPPKQSAQKPGGTYAWTDKKSEAEKAEMRFIQELVLHEDKDLFVLNKPPGLAVQGGTNITRHVDGLIGLLQGDSEYRPKLVHRLDRETSGLLVIAKHPAAAAELGALFRSRALEKLYWAITVKVPQPHSGQVRCWMAKGNGEDEMEDKERMYRARQGMLGAKHAITDYAVISTAGQRAAWVALKPVTGRTHQLRFHMSELGASILGDQKYATRKEVPTGIASGLHLHARRLILPRPKQKPLDISAPLPAHMQETFKTLGFLESEAREDILLPDRRG